MFTTSCQTHKSKGPYNLVSEPQGETISDPHLDPGQEPLLMASPSTQEIFFLKKLVFSVQELEALGYDPSPIFFNSLTLTIKNVLYFLHNFLKKLPFVPDSTTTQIWDINASIWNVFYNAGIIYYHDSSPENRRQLKKLRQIAKQLQELAEICERSKTKQLLSLAEFSECTKSSCVPTVGNSKPPVKADAKLIQQNDVKDNDKDSKSTEMSTSNKELVLANNGADATKKKTKSLAKEAAPTKKAASKIATAVQKVAPTPAVDFMSMLSFNRAAKPICAFQGLIEASVLKLEEKFEVLEDYLGIINHDKRKVFVFDPGGKIATPKVLKRLTKLRLNLEDKVVLKEWGIVTLTFQQIGQAFQQTLELEENMNEDKTIKESMGT